jgi:hypothetical protein
LLHHLSLPTRLFADFTTNVGQMTLEDKWISLFFGHSGRFESTFSLSFHSTRSAMANPNRLEGHIF